MNAEVMGVTWSMHRDMWSYYNNFIENPEGKRHFGGPRSRENSIGRDFKEMGGGGCKLKATGSS